MSGQRITSFHIPDVAFPQEISPVGLSGGPIHVYGLTKREVFAGMAMQAILTGAVTRGCPSSEWFEMESAVQAADALLKELAK